MFTTFNNTGLISDFNLTVHTDGSVTKKALVAVEGSFADSNGNTHSFNSERLSNIANMTNAALSKGQPLPVCTDHDKTVKGTVGFVNGNAYTKIITEDDLPNKKASHLVGKLGLFFDQVVIKSRDVAEKVSNGIVNSVSMGLNLDTNGIVELSLVPIPAIPNMGLFKFNAGIRETNAFTWEDLEIQEESLDDLEEEYKDLTENLWSLLNNIYTNENIEIPDEMALKQYVYNALNGFSTRIITLLGLDEEAQAQGMGTEQMAQQDMQTMQAMQGGAEQVSQDSMTAPYSYPRQRTIQFSYSRKPKYVRAIR